LKNTVFIQWVNLIDCNNEPLSEVDREKLVKAMMTKEKYTFKQLRKLIGKEDSYYQFNIQDDEIIRKAHTVPNLSAKKFFGSSWFGFSDKEKEDIWHTLIFFDDKKKLEDYAVQKWGFSPDQAIRISNFRLKDGYANHSLKAIRNILPFLKAGHGYSNAVALGGVRNAFGEQWHALENKEELISRVLKLVAAREVGGFIDPLRTLLRTDYGLSERALGKLYHHSAEINTNELLARLPVSPQADKELQEIRNPVVIASLFELRKLVNQLIELHGRPDKINIELARDLKVSKSRRNERKLEQFRLQRENDRVRDEINRLGYDMSKANILKYKLWEECNKTCPFTGRQIAISDLFTPQVEVEHIHPLSKSLNDSFMNKTLCFADENKRKGHRTPYEYYFQTFGEEKWEEIKRQALSCLKNKEHYPSAYYKFKHFVKERHDDDFVSRQLNDTRYISKSAAKYLSKICKDITPLPGQMTAILRKLWGLNRILNPDDIKEREDHRHHAVDALVVACTKRKYLQELSTRAEYDDTYKSHVNFPDPWESFRAEAEQKVETIMVSHKTPGKALTSRMVKVTKGDKSFINRGIAARGQLHVETVYGKRQAPGLGKAYHVRKPLDTLTTEKHIGKVVDPIIRTILLEQIRVKGGFSSSGKIPDGAFFDRDEQGRQVPLVFLPNKHGEPVPVRKVRIREVLSNAVELNNGRAWVNPRNNHHVVIYKNEDGSMDEEIVTFWTVVERKLQKQPTYQLPEGGVKILATLRENDLFVMGFQELPNLDTSEGKKAVLDHLYKVQKISSKLYTFRKHTDSRMDKQAQTDYLRIQSFGEGKTGWLTHNPIKVRLSVAGKIRPA